MTETVSGVAFWLLAASALLGAIMMVSTRSVVHAAFWLLGVMLAIAGLFLLLSAEFLAMVQIMVYAGAVTVMLLFVIMLTLRRREDALRPLDASVGAAVLSSLLLAAVLIAVRAFTAPAAVMPAEAPGTEALGRVMFTTWALPFEVASVVLLVALVAAVWWSGEGGPE